MSIGYVCSKGLKFELHYNVSVVFVCCGCVDSLQRNFRLLKLLHSWYILEVRSKVFEALQKLDIFMSFLATLQLVFGHHDEHNTIPELKHCGLLEHGCNHVFHSLGLNSHDAPLIFASTGEIMTLAVLRGFNRHTCRPLSHSIEPLYPATI